MCCCCEQLTQSKGFAVLLLKCEQYTKNARPGARLRFLFAWYFCELAFNSLFRHSPAELCQKQRVRMWPIKLSKLSGIIHWKRSRNNPQKIGSDCTEVVLIFSLRFKTVGFNLPCFIAGRSLMCSGLAHILLFCGLGSFTLMLLNSVDAPPQLLVWAHRAQEANSSEPIKLACACLLDMSKAKCWVI